MRPNLTVIRQSPRHIALIAFSVCTPIAIACGSLTFSVYGLGFHTAIFTYAILLLAYGAWGEFRENRREVEIKMDSRTVSIHERTLTGKRRISTFHLSSLTSVASYIGPGKLNSVRVELFTHNLTHGLFVCRFEPAPNGAEPIEAQNLRNQLAVELGLVDEGFLGGRFRPPRFVQKIAKTPGEAIVR